MSVPTPIDMLMGLFGCVSGFIRSVISTPDPQLRAAPVRHTDAYDARRMGWVGEEGLLYRIPPGDLPSDRHVRDRYFATRILLYNVQQLCNKDLLPATKEEKEFWAAYTGLRIRLLAVPFFSTLPFVYFTLGRLHRLLHPLLRTRMTAVALSLSIADLWNVHAFPGHAWMHRALAARTPLGDAARAEWQRLQSVQLTESMYLIYVASSYIGRPVGEFAFGGDLTKL